MGETRPYGARPLVVVLAGPNDAGKSTLAPCLLRDELAVETFVNADTIAQGLSAYRPESAAVAAGRIFLEHLRRLAAERRDFAFETTLAGRAHARWLAKLRADGYRVHLVFLSLPSVDLALARVATRVRLGGHHVPDDAVRRRFEAGQRLFDGLYRRVADSWQLHDNAGATPRLLAFQRGGESPVVVDATAARILGPSTVGERPTDDLAPSDRVDDVGRTLRALRRATREAILRHRAASVPMALWRDGRAALVDANDLPLDSLEDPPVDIRGARVL